MAVPSIYSLAPTKGLSSGRERVRIDGAFFRLPTPPLPENGPTTGDMAPSVAVTFDGVAADFVAVLDDGYIVAVTPEFRGDPAALPAAVDVAVQNVDDAGAAIPGESFTLPGAFTYERPDIAEESGVTWVTRQLMRQLRRVLIDNVAVSSSPDYSTSPFAVAAVGELPAILLEGPEVAENRFYRYNDLREADYEDGIGRNAHAFTADLSYDIILIARRKVEASNLCDAAIRYFKRRPRFRFAAGPTDPEILEVRWYLAPWSAADRFPDQVFMFESRLRLEALHIDDPQGMPADDVLSYETVDADEGYLELLTTNGGSSE